MKAVFQALRAHADSQPEALAISDDSRQITWGQLAQAVGRAAAGFAAGPQTVGLQLTGIDYAIADLAATLAGCRVVPVPGFFSPAQIAHLMQDAGAELVSDLPQAGRAMALNYAGGAERVI